MSHTEARRNHYAGFYGLSPLPAGAPLVVVFGNCQAESLRIMLEGADIGSVRIPPVHELTAADLPHLQRVLSHTEILVSQPVNEGYRGMPLGTTQVAGLLKSAGRLCVIPNIFYAGLYPYQALVRAPSDPSLTPPIVAYHDLRVLAEAAGLVDDQIYQQTLSTAQVLTIADLALAELRRRETQDGSLVISDVFAKPTFGHMRTINHPGNLVFRTLADRVRESLGLMAGTADVGRELLNDVRAPKEVSVIEAFGLAESPTSHWMVGGESVSSEEVRQAHLQWYHEHPDAVVGGLERHRDVLQILGLSARSSKG